MEIHDLQQRFRLYIFCILPKTEFSSGQGLVRQSVYRLTSV